MSLATVANESKEEESDDRLRSRPPIDNATVIPIQMERVGMRGMVSLIDNVETRDGHLHHGEGRSRKVRSSLCDQ